MILAKFGPTRYEDELKYLYLLRWCMGLTALAACTLLLLDYGYYLTTRGQMRVETGQLTLALIFLGGYILQLLIRRDRRLYLRANLIKYAFSLTMLFELGLVYGVGFDLKDALLFQGLEEITFRHPHVLFVQLYLISNVIRWIVKITQYLAQYNASPARFILLSFGSAIIGGASLLLLPKAAVIALSPLDALFTATSAICVTGLIVVDTANAFTHLGQLIILGLIQVGGLGIMTVTAFFSLLVGQRMSGREQVLLGDMLGTQRVARLGSVIRAVFLTTILIEACGALALYLSWRTHFPARTSFYSAVFHSISAFCNAGFSTHSNSIMGFATNWPINLTIGALIIFGGLGFGTLRNLAVFASGKIRRKTQARLSVQSKIIVVMTGLLLLLGTLFFLLLESSNTLYGFSWTDRLLGAFFQSVTFRTAGFNSVDFGSVKEATQLMAIVLMFIGAAPGSTGGGIKVTTLAILLATVLASTRGQTRLVLFHRTIPNTVLYQTLVVITMYLAVMMGVSFCLTMTEVQIRPLALLFETVSALGTVGLSTGITSQLSVPGKLLIILTMFVGRVGPFTLALAIGQRQRVERYSYPEERVQIG